LENGDKFRGHTWVYKPAGGEQLKTANKEIPGQQKKAGKKSRGQKKL